MSRITTLIGSRVYIRFFHEQGVSPFIENIGLYSRVQGKVNPAFKMIASVLDNVAEMERKFILERQKQGIEIAKPKGIYKGRLHGTKMTDQQLLDKYKSVVTELKKGESLRRAAKLGSCSLGTAQRIKSILEKLTSSEFRRSIN